MLTLYSMPSSGNSYKVRMLFARLGVAFRHVEAENGSGVTRTPEFLALNPKGKVPLIVWEDGRTLSESNAILCRFGEGTRYWPADPDERAAMLAWMFWEQNAHEPSIAVRAGILTYADRAHRRTPAELDPLLDSGHAALGVMEERLARGPFLAGEAVSLADLCLYAYTHTRPARGAGSPWIGIRPSTRGSHASPTTRGTCRSNGWAADAAPRFRVVPPRAAS